MKIAVFYNLDFGGAKRAAFEQVRGLSARGNTVDVYTTNFEADIFDVALYARSVNNYPFGIESEVPVLGKIISDYRKLVELKKLHRKIASDIDKNNYDVVLAHPDKFTQSSFLLRFLKTPSVYYCQEPLRIAYEYRLRVSDALPAPNRLYDTLERGVLKKIDKDNVRSATLTLASCYHIRERMIEAYDVFPKVAYLGVDEKMFRPLHLKKKNQVFFVGSKSNAIDGFDLAEKAIRLISQKMRPKLQVVSWKKENGQRLSDEELVILYNQSIATLSLSRFETFGLVPLESMSCGVPVIATNVSGHRETVVNGKTGFLVDFDPQEIADKIVYLLENKNAVEEMGKTAREWVLEKWTWEKSISQLEKILLGVKNK